MSFPLLIAVGRRSIANVVPTPDALRRLVVESRTTDFVVQYVSPARIQTSELLEADRAVRQQIDAALVNLPVLMASSCLSFHRGVFDLEIVLSWRDNREA